MGFILGASGSQKVAKLHKKTMQKMTSKKGGPEEAWVFETFAEPRPRRGVRGEVNLPPWGFGGSEKIRKIKK